MPKAKWTPLQTRQAKYMLAEGATYREIGEKIGKSASSVKMHLKRLESSQPARQKSGSGQLCWGCAKAVGLCVWSASKCTVPQPGWTAEEVDPPLGYPSKGPWYRVIECPNFEEG